jgi:uncharacterized protein
MFEFDSLKSAANLIKHGIDFVSAQKLWAGGGCIFRVQSEPEERYALVNTWDSKIWTAIFTRRGNAVRIISVRRARKEEIQFYEEKKDY